MRESIENPEQKTNQIHSDEENFKDMTLDEYLSFKCHFPDKVKKAEYIKPTVRTRDIVEQIIQTGPAKIRVWF